MYGLRRTGNKISYESDCSPDFHCGDPASFGVSPVYTRTAACFTRSRGLRFLSRSKKDEMTMTDLFTSAKSLAQARKHEADCNAALQAEAKNLPQPYIDALAKHSDAKKALKSADEETRSIALQIHSDTKSKELDAGITIRENKLPTVLYDPAKAFQWAKRFFPEAIILDTGLFEKHALALQSTKPVPFVDYVTQFSYSAVIPSDLSNLLEKENNDE
jgi:hypothetical protein